MMFKATLTFSLVFLAVSGYANTAGGPDPSTISPSVYSSAASHIIPSGTPMSNPPTTSDGNSIPTIGIRPSGCRPPHSAIPTSQPLSSGVYSILSVTSSSMASSSMASSSMASSSMASSSMAYPSSCQPDYGSTIHTGTPSAPPSISEGALPTMNISKPAYSMSSSSSSGNFTITPVASPTPYASGPDEQKPPATAVPAASYVGRRRLIRRQA